MHYLIGIIRFIKHMNEQKSIKKNFLMNILLTLSGIIFPIISFPYVSRILGPEGTGKVDFASSIMGYFSLFAQLGIPTYGIRACARVRDNKLQLSRTVAELMMINLIMTLFSYIVFVPMLFLIPLLFLFAGAVNNAAAQDSGEERTIDVTEWQCWLCGKQFFTLTPDDINANTKPQHKEFNFQQATWRILKDGSTIRKCEKAHDGAHIMLKKRDFQTSGYIVMTNAERYIVVRGASAIRTPINVVQCVGCQKTALCFKGDDLDEWGFLSLNKVTNVFAMKSGSKIGSCDKITLPGMTKLVPHLFNVRTTKSMSSEAILQSYSSFLCSD